LRRYDRYRASQFLGFIDLLPALDVRPFDQPELSKTRAMLSRFGDQNLTLADAHGLVIMEGLQAVTCWSTDRHLGLSGTKLAIQV
jgi:hypothetical protein